MLLQFCASILFLLFIGKTTGVGFFLHPRASPELINAARSIGEREQEAFYKKVSKLNGNGQDRATNLEIEMELYSTHLLSCSAIGANLTKHLEDSIGSDSQSTEGNSGKKRSIETLKSVGFDDVVTRLFMLPSYQIDELIKSACLKHELQFQCADAFLNNPSKIYTSIEKMKAADGNVKIMFEGECAKDNEEINIPEIYSCIGSNADEIRFSCNTLISIFDKARGVLNTRINLLYRLTIEDNLALINEETTEDLSSKHARQRQLKKTIKKIQQLESARCRIYSKMEKCAVNTIVDQCGPKSREVAQTLLDVGHLRRERGDSMHSHFEEEGITTPPTCYQYI